MNSRASSLSAVATLYERQGRARLAAGETALGVNFVMSGGRRAPSAQHRTRRGNVAFVARVGQDVFGERAIEGLVKDGVNVDPVLRDAKHSDLNNAA